ncbi:MAG: valine--tRNA ligase [Gemmatimonadota bacterium]|nr:MAG: valine--tRNA ligase [Gemmatimonadota bacterium]
MTTKTELASKYDPSTIERETYQRWIDAGVFTASPESEREPYVIVIPPPNVTSVLHMGHGLNNTLQDVLIRFQRMRGREVLWLPGTDHAGIATQNMVERQLAKEGMSRHDMGRAAFVERVWEHVHHTGGTILEQLKALGSSCDWTRTRFTLDEQYSSAVRKVFVDLYHEGLLYRGYRVIHWCPRCHTALSDEEAEFRERDDHLYYIRYPVVDGQGTDGSVIVATTRPETMYGDVALVHHPEDERFRHLAGKTVMLPLSNVPIPVETSTYVEQDFGTGILKVTPAHDPHDFEIAAELPGNHDTPVVIDADARMAHDPRVPEAVRGLDRDAARQKTVELLEAAGLLQKIEPYRHAVRHCYRCHTVVEPRLSDQWFVRMKPLAEPALEAYRQGRLRFVPERWGKVYENWLTEIRDWNISRQLWWGHQIPAWYCESEDCDHVTVAMDAPAACERCGGPVRQDEDVLDTWFSSWLWPFATMGWPERTADLERFYPGHTLVTAPDIIFFWVARMVMAGYHFQRERPFTTVYLNGVVRDPQHRAFSKSLGNGIDPLDVVERYGADALRYTLVAGAAAGTDVILDRDQMDGTFAAGRNFANKLWNMGRLLLSAVGDAAPPPESLDPAQFELADRWILSRCQRVVADVTEALERYRLNDAAGLVYHFLWGDVADWYLEQIKPRLYGSVAGGDVASAVAVHVFQAALRLLHPIMPFISEELWRHLPGEREEHLAAAAWPAPQGTLIDEEAEDQFAHVQALVTAVRTVRAEYGVAPGTEVRAFARPANAAALQACNAEQRTIERLAKLSHLSLEDPPEEIGAHQVLPDGSSVFVPLGDAIDVRQECQRLAAERDRVDRQLAGVEAKLANERFISRAPAEVVERERDKERSWREQRETLADKLRALGC